MVVIYDIVFLNIFSKDLSNNLSYLARIKVEELSRDYLNNTIKKYLNIDTNDYIKVNFVNNSIISVDIDNSNSNVLLKNVIEDLENNFSNVLGNDIDYYNLELLEGNKGIIIYIPIGSGFDNSLLAGMGPNIPVKISFLENIDSYVDVDVENYGINNSLVKLYININIKVIIEMPIDKDVININYKYLVASKLISGKVPNIFGNNLQGTSSIVNSSVK